MSGRKGVECGKLHNLPPCTANLLLHPAKRSSFANSARCTIQSKRSFMAEQLYGSSAVTRQIFGNIFIFHNWKIWKTNRMSNSSRKMFNVVVVTDPPWVTSESLVEDLVSPQFPLLPPAKWDTCYLLPKLWQADYCTNFLAATFSPKMGKLPHSISSGSQYTWVWYHPPPFYTRSANRFSWWSSVTLIGRVQTKMCFENWQCFKFLMIMIISILF